jgi:hypothetical protein
MSERRPASDEHLANWQARLHLLIIFLKRRSGNVNDNNDDKRRAMSTRKFVSKTWTS